MPSKSKSKKTKKSKIVDANCYVKLTEKAVFIEYEDETYVGNREYLEKLLEGKLKTKEKKKKAKSINLGLMEDDEIQETDVFLTKKGESMYFVPEEDQVLIAPISAFEKLIEGEWSYVRMGKFS